MPFSSLVFVCVFLPACLLTYWLAAARARNAVALLFSVAFYAWGAPRFLPVVLALGLVDFAIARGIARAQGRPRQYLLALGICMHLSVLAYFKYANFAVAQLNIVRVALDAPPALWKQVVLPIGVSFITFEEISYLVDVYRGDAAPAKRIPQYLLFLLLFPHSIAGPIFRWKDLAHQLEVRSTTVEGLLNGIVRFSFGLGKKILVADSVAQIVDTIFGLPPAETSCAYAWVGALGYAIQIYFDFSGYSDMAIGLGTMLGFTFKENFREPYVASSFSDFWGRWHISLSTWMRDYLYIPLGGNRRGATRTDLNTMTVFLLSGLWHGAAWTFVLWGAYHGILLVLERRFEAALAVIPARARRLFTFTLVVIGWVFFRAGDAAQARSMLSAMAGISRPLLEARPLPAEMFPRFSTLVLVGSVVYVVARMMVTPRGDRLPSAPSTSWRRPAVSLVLLAVSLMHMTNMRYMPLIYFKF